MICPRDPDPRFPLSPEWGRVLLAYVRSIEPRPGRGIKIRRSPGGAVIGSVRDNSPEPVASSSGASGPFPFDVTLVDLVPGTSKTASVRPGSINSILPSNYTTTYTTLNATDYYLVLTVTVSAGQVTSCVLSMPTSPPSGIPVTNGAPPTSFEVLLGLVSGGNWYRVIGDGSLQATSAEAYRVSKVAPAPGTLPYDIWYTWQLTNV